MKMDDQAKVRKNAEYRFTILDLPELAVESIMEKLSTADLFNMGGVCRSLRERCRSDHLWEKHLKRKWGSIIGQAAYTDWLLFTESSKGPRLLDGGKSKGWLSFVPCLWHPSGVRTKTNSFPSDSIMNLFLSLENGKFWFPAQVFNHQKWFCYDAVLSYDRSTNTFHARYPPYRQQRLVVEKGIEWNRVRATPSDVVPYNLHVSSCLNDLNPEDHIEVQWRMRKELPFGWWYGVVGHLQSCDGNQQLCRCSHSDYVVIEFKQYSIGSRWRKTILHKKDYTEMGNGEDGFYGGIRKLYSEEEISMWNNLRWPNEELLHLLYNMPNVA